MEWVLNPTVKTVSDRSQKSHATTALAYLSGKCLSVGKSMGNIWEELEKVKGYRKSILNERNNKTL